MLRRATPGVLSAWPAHRRGPVSKPSPARRWSTRVTLVLTAIFAAMIAVPGVSYANGGTLESCDNQGCSLAQFQTGEFLRVQYRAQDTSCNGKHYGTKVTVKPDGGSAIENEVWVTSGCNHTEVRTSFYSAAQLGSRTGTIEIRRCYKTAVGVHVCDSAAADSRFWNF
jgi:hypothetical protein